MQVQYQRIKNTVIDYPASAFGSAELIGCLSCLQVFKVLGREGINVKMMSQGASKNNISLIVSDDEGKNAVRSLHQEFFN